MIEIILAASLGYVSGPLKAVPIGDRSNWVRANDLAKISRDAARTTIDLIIDENGKAVDCRVVIGSGQNDLDKSVCRALVRRARFRPATTEDGSKVRYVYRDRITWAPQAEGRNYVRTDADLVITSEKLQQTPTGLAEVFVILSGGATPPRCKVASTSGSDVLDNLACEIAVNPEVAPPVTDANGEQVSAIRSFYVGFEPGTMTSVRVR